MSRAMYLTLGNLHRPWGTLAVEDRPWLGKETILESTNMSPVPKHQQENYRLALVLHFSWHTATIPLNFTSLYLSASNTIFAVLWASSTPLLASWKRQTPHGQEGSRRDGRISNFVSKVRRAKMAPVECYVKMYWVSGLACGFTLDFCMGEAMKMHLGR